MTFCEIWVADHPLPVRDRWLAPAETRRLAQISHPPTRRASAAAHVLLRLALAHHLNISPVDVPLIRHCPQCDSRQHGPPVAPGSGLTVSIAHAENLVLVAISNAEAVGVDVEHLPLPGTHIPTDTLNLTLSTSEHQRLAELPGTEQAATFLQWWTRKESVFKAAGDGLPANPADLDLSQVTGIPFTIRWPTGAPASPYWVSDLNLTVAHAVASVCLTSAPTTLTIRNAKLLLGEETHHWHRSGTSCDATAARC